MMKTCPNCSADVIENFEICWKCNYEFGGVGLRNDNTIDNKETENIINCLRCNTQMENRGKLQLHEGTRYGFLGDLAELLVNKETFQLYACPACGKVEFFV